MIMMGGAKKGNNTWRFEATNKSQVLKQEKMAFNRKYVGNIITFWWYDWLS
jgi:hypothetical protein